MYVHPIPSDENEMLPQLSIRLLPVSRISDVEKTGKEPFRSVVWVVKDATQKQKSLAFSSKRLVMSLC